MGSERAAEGERSGERAGDSELAVEPPVSYRGSDTLVLDLYSGSLN